MAITDTNVLKSKKDELEAWEQKLVDEFLATALVQHVLAPLKSEIAVLEEKLESKDEKQAD